MFVWLVGGVNSNPPFEIGNWVPFLEAGWLSLVFGASAGVQLYRFLRSASPLQRQQIKWLLYGFVPVILIPICISIYMTFVPGLNVAGAYLNNIPHSVFLVFSIPLYRLWYLPIPFCVGIALLRYRLWDIDVIINRTLVYGALSAILVTLYISVVILAQAAVGAFDPRAAASPIIVVASTLLIAALFTPLRRSLQAGIDRRFYRSKYDATQVMSRFGEALRQEVNLEELSEHLIDVVQETMQPCYLSLRLLPRRTGEMSALSEVGPESDR